MGARCRWAQRNRLLSGGFGMLGTTLAFTMYTMGAPKPFGSSSWAAGGGGVGWGSGSDGEGVRLAQLRGEQACNTNQGDLVMDRRLTESPLCLCCL